MNDRRTRALAGVVALTTATATLVVPPQAAAAPETAAGGGTQHQVTLITGDKVRATQRANGQWRLTVDRAPEGASFGADQYPVTRNGRTDWYLVPHRATRLVGEGKLDRELFNITGLIRQGYDDARSPATPLLVQYPEAGLTSRSRALPGTRAQRELPNLNLAAVDQQKSDAQRFWRELTHQGPGALSSGLHKIWLNGRVQSTLDKSVPQVGAPTAWQAGFTGKGVTVAVLDTGIDDSHPDVAGKVKHSRDFSGKGNVTDGQGHGTHVAATVAGTGAADGGKFKGVAPEADLAIGKVLDDSGSGNFADIIAGMEWAAREVKAKIVSMSLGGMPTDGTDPASQALNTLSRQHGTLFVVAAGNFGQPGSVGTPGSADLALTVGSVTKSDSLSEFSSQGPREGDGAVKPEISAPGSDIVAARAAGTSLGRPVNERYSSLSGTSMATPHISGGAAILAQQHPDWTGEQLKSALVSTSAPLAGNGVFTVGAGRMDLGKAVGAKVLASPSVVNGFLKFSANPKPETRVVTYTNPGTAPVTLNLKLDLAGADGRAAPAAMARLSANTVTVPAGGKAEVTLTLTPKVAAEGSYGGVLTATDGTTTVRSLVGAHEEGERYDIGTKVLRPDGTPATAADGHITLIRPKNPTAVSIEHGGTARVAPGTYSAMGILHTTKPGGDPATTLFANPVVKVGKAGTLSFDTRQAKRVTVSTEPGVARGGAWFTGMRQQVEGMDQSASMGVEVDPRFHDISSFSTPGVSSPTFGYSNHLRLEEPGIEFRTEGAQPADLFANWLFGRPDKAFSTKLSTVDGGGGTPAELAELDVKGKLVVVSFPRFPTEEEARKRMADVQAAGGAAIAIRFDPEPAAAATQWPTTAPAPGAIPGVMVYTGSGTRLLEHAKKGGEVSLTGRLFSKQRYELAFPSTGRIPARQDLRVRTAELAEVTNVYHGYREQEPPVVSATASSGVARSELIQGSPGVPSGERVEHFTPGDWELSVAGWHSEAGELTERMRLEAGKSYRQEWNKAVNGPGFRGTHSNELGKDHPWAWTKGRMIDVTVPWFADAAGHPRVAGSGQTLDKGTTVLHGDGKELGRHNSPGRGTFLRGSFREYRLDAEVSRDAPWWPTSTKISASWTFPAPKGDSGPLGLLSVRYAPPVDLRNLAPGDRDFTIPVTVTRQDGPDGASSLAVEYSVDEGASWQQATVDRTEAGWSVTVRNPAKGSVSLRAKASDGTRSVEQTVLKAYQIG